MNVERMIGVAAIDHRPFFVVSGDHILEQGLAAVEHSILLEVDTRHKLVVVGFGSPLSSSSRIISRSMKGLPPQRSAYFSKYQPQLGSWLRARAMIVPSFLPQSSKATWRIASGLHAQHLRDARQALRHGKRTASGSAIGGVACDDDRRERDRIRQHRRRVAAQGSSARAAPRRRPRDRSVAAMSAAEHFAVLIQVDDAGNRRVRRRTGRGSRSCGEKFRAAGAIPGGRTPRPGLRTDQRAQA